MFFLPDLKRQCGSYLANFIDIENVVDLLQTARLFNIPRLEHQCVEFMANGIEEVCLFILELYYCILIFKTFFSLNFLKIDCAWWKIQAVSHKRCGKCQSKRRNWFDRHYWWASICVANDEFKLACIDSRSWKSTFLFEFIFGGFGISCLILSLISLMKHNFSTIGTPALALHTTTSFVFIF